MKPEIELTRVSGGDCGEFDCPAGYISNRNTVVFQGPAVVHAEGLRLGEGELAVEVPVEIAREALRALGG